MKVLERLVLKFLQTVTYPLLDPHQFAYRSNRSVDDAVALGLHYIYQHLESAGAYARILFVDYSSAFNTIIPEKLYDKLIGLGVPKSMCAWILDFLLNRPQIVKIGNMTSNESILNTGAPQGCVLSPLLFTLFTNDCVSHHQSVHIIKFSDDTTLEGLISNRDESYYRAEVEELVSWCTQNNLELNVSKTKEIIVDFRTKKSPILPLLINGEHVEQVKSFKFLGTTISHDLKWSDHIGAAVKKARQRMYFLRQLHKFRVSQAILSAFYRSVIESILTFSITVWYGNTTVRDKSMINKIIRNASNIIKTDVPSLDEIFKKRAVRRALNTFKDKVHPANSLLQPLPSAKRLRSIKTKSTRFTNSFYPCAIRMINEESSKLLEIIRTQV